MAVVALCLSYSIATFYLPQRKNLPRPARKRGNDKKTECRKIPVMIARDRTGSTVDGVLDNESGDELCKHLNGRINIETVVCADASLAHEKLARKLGFIFKELGERQSTIYRFRNNCHTPFL